MAYGAEGVVLYDLRLPSAAPLAPFEPGAHIDVQMPGGLVRSYSLVNPASEVHRYVIGVKREPASKGGSAWLHDAARIGMILGVSEPRNDFKLHEDAAFTIFFAGGIGITPLWNMAQRLIQVGRPWKLHYRGRSRTSTAFLDELAAEATAGKVVLSFTDEGDERPDMPAIVASAPAGTHFYCCGPLAMLEGFEAACEGTSPANVHAEYFQAKQSPSTEGGFKVRLARRGLDLTVEPGQTVLDAVSAAGVAVASSCQQGVCGACETRVLAGTPDHRDLVLSEQERRSGCTMMICCSGSLSCELVLDL